MTIGITGATGQLGRLVVDRMKRQVGGEEIVALVRNPAKAADLGVQVREADYGKPETLTKALPGIDTLVLISGSEVGQRAIQHRNIIDAAKRGGVKWIIYTSLLHADRSPLDLAPEHLATEQALAESGIPYTLLRNGWYTENYTGSIGGVLAGGAVMGSARDGRISSAARKDFADAIVAVARDPQAHMGKIHELAGDEAWTLADYAREISRQTGREIPYNDVPEEQYASALAGFDIPEPFAKVIAGWDAGAAQGALYDDGHQLSKLIGRPTTPMAETVREALQAAGVELLASVGQG